MTGKPDTDREHWSRIADEWIAWARTPNHDAFWAYRDAFVDFVGVGDGAALDVGCGEGRISRELKKCGYRVTAVDQVEALLNSAREAESADDYAVAAAADLPFPVDSFDLVVAYNMLMDVDDVPAAVKQMRRVLCPDGRLVISVVHPFADHGRFLTHDADSPLVVKGTYFGRQRFEDTVERDGCGCALPDGCSPWKTMRPRWKVPAWRSRPSASQRQAVAVRTTCSAGSDGRCSSG